MFLTLILMFFNYAHGQDAFFSMGIGPDFGIVDKDNSRLSSKRARVDIQLGTKNVGFAFQPSFGSGYTSIYIGPVFMLPFQVGSKGLFVVPDASLGVDFSFDDSVLGTSLDMKFGFKVFYEIQPSMAIAFRPFGLCLRPFNIWYGGTPNQIGLVLRYEIMLGFAYFF